MTRGRVEAGVCSGWTVEQVERANNLCLRLVDAVQRSLPQQNSLIFSLSFLSSLALNLNVTDSYGAVHTPNNVACKIA